MNGMLVVKYFVVKRLKNHLNLENNKNGVRERGK
jgi:hypothetical protein